MMVSGYNKFVAFKKGELKTFLKSPKPRQDEQDDLTVLSPLCQAIAGHDVCATRLLLLNGADYTEMCHSPLVFAVQCRFVEGVRLLLLAGSDPNACGGAPLISAATLDDTEIAELLWKAGAELDILDSCPHRVASSCNSQNMLTWLASKA